MSKFTSLATAALTTLALALGTSAGTAAAASNGQQIDVYGYGQASVNLCGQNQNNEYVCHKFNTPSYYTLLSGWWWKGAVQMRDYSAQHVQDGEGACYVPEKQKANFVYCHGVD